MQLIFLVGSLVGGSRDDDGAERVPASSLLLSGVLLATLFTGKSAAMRGSAGANLTSFLAAGGCWVLLGMLEAFCVAAGVPGSSRVG